eukprot:1805886-Rhodomonas_salina.4
MTVSVGCTVDSVTCAIRGILKQYRYVKPGTKPLATRCVVTEPVYTRCEVTESVSIAMRGTEIGFSVRCAVGRRLPLPGAPRTALTGGLGAV